MDCQTKIITALIGGWFIGLVCGAAYMKVQFNNAFKIWTDIVYENYRKGIDKLKGNKE